MTRVPRSVVSDHTHPETWTKDDHYRFEARVTAELEKVEQAVARLTTRVTLMLGALTLVAFLLPVIAPFVRLWIGADVPQGQ